MKTVTTAQLRSRLSMLQGRPRVVVSGNLATPWKAVEALDHAVPTYILNILNGAEGIPTREGVIAETCFVGAGQRHHPALSYVPCRLSMVPDATLAALRDRKDLRVWTEMFSDGVLDLEERGAMDHTTPIITSFVAGSQRLYDWLDGNRRVLMQRTERTNDPALIARQRGMVSINTALQVDLFGQANASRINGRIHSGSAVRPTSSSVRCTPPADTRSSRCAPGTPRRTCRPSSPASRTRRRASSRVRS